MSVSTRNIDFTYNTIFIMVTNIVFVCDEQHFLFVCVHLFVSSENSKVHAVVNLLYIQHYLCHWTTRIVTVKTTQKVLPSLSLSLSIYIYICMSVYIYRKP